MYRALKVGWETTTVYSTVYGTVTRHIISYYTTEPKTGLYTVVSQNTSYLSVLTILTTVISYPSGAQSLGWPFDGYDRLLQVPFFMLVVMGE